MGADLAGTWSASEAAARTGLSSETLRYYEREGLLPPVGRSVGGHRRYAAVDMQRLSFLINLRATGMPLTVMKRFAQLRLEGEPGRSGRLQLLLDHRETVRERLAILHRNLCAIDLKIDRHCRILRDRGEAMPEQASTTTGDFDFVALHHTQLAMPQGEEDAARAFYAGPLGMIESQKPPVLAARGGCWFRRGGLELHLGVEDPFTPAKKAHPGLLIEGLPRLAAALEDAGHTVTWDDNFPGYSRFYANDPFGTSSNRPATHPSRPHGSATEALPPQSESPARATQPEPSQLLLVRRRPQSAGAEGTRLRVWWVARGLGPTTLVALGSSMLP